MKKILVSILTLLYFSSAIGAAEYLKYGLQALRNPCLLHAGLTTCTKIGNEKKGEPGKLCSQRENRTFSYHSDHIAPSSIYHLQNPVAFTLTGISHLTSCTFDSILDNQNSIRYTLAQNCSVAIYIRNCVFLI